MFDVTFEIVTDESARDGDAESRGYVAESLGLREAIETLFETRTSQCDGVQGIEASRWPLMPGFCVTVYNGMEFETGARESRSLHMPRDITFSSAKRIARLCGVA